MILDSFLAESPTRQLAVAFITTGEGNSVPAQHVMFQNTKFSIQRVILRQLSISRRHKKYVYLPKMATITLREYFEKKAAPVNI